MALLAFGKLQVTSVFPGWSHTLCGPRWRKSTSVWQVPFSGLVAHFVGYDGWCRGVRRDMTVVILSRDKLQVASVLRAGRTLCVGHDGKSPPPRGRSLFPG